MGNQTNIHIDTKAIEKIASMVLENFLDKLTQIVVAEILKSDTISREKISSINIQHRLVTEQMLKEYKLSKGSIVQVKPQAIFTPLAVDYIKDNHIEIIKNL